MLLYLCRLVGIGRRAALKMRCLWRPGSIPGDGTLLGCWLSWESTPLRWQESGLLVCSVEDIESSVRMQMEGALLEVLILPVGRRL